MKHTFKRITAVYRPKQFPLSSSGQLLILETQMKCVHVAVDK